MEEYGGSFDVVQPGMSENSGSAYPWERMIPLVTTGGHPPPGGGVVHKGGSGFLPIKPVLVGPTTSAPVLHQANTVNGNKMTILPLVGWTARGGLPVSFALVHNSQSSHNSTLGQKWTHSFDIYGKTDGNGNVTIHWGDDQSYTFTKNISGSFTAPAGIFDSLVENVGGTYTLTTHDQVTYQFNTSLQCTSLSDENSNTITLSYTSGVLTSITDPTSRSLTIAYSSGRISTITDPKSRVFTMHYDGSGNLSQVDFPALSGTTYSYYLSYNTAHDLTDLETPRGYHWTFNYNSDDSLNWAKDPYSNETSTSYSGATMTVTDPNSHSTLYTYDTSGRITQVKDPLLYHQDFSSYTSNNQPQTVTDARGYNWTFTYDSSGNTLTAEDPNSNTWTYTYNSHNRVLTAKLPSLRQTVFTYDTQDNLTEVDHKDSSGTIQATEKYTPNTYGLTTDFYDANSHHYQYGYDTNGDLISQTTPNSHETQWTYDALGVIATREDALLRTTTYTPDAWERITTITYPDTSTHTFTYDVDDNLTQFVDATGTTTRSYDNADRCTGESKGGSTVVSYSYDATGQKGLLSTVTDANSRAITLSYTSRQELYQVSETAGTATYGYDANGNETNITNQNGTTVTNGFDNADNLTSVTNKNSTGTVLSSFSYVPDVDGRRSSCTEASGDVISYGYDWGGRLTSESRTGTHSYSESYGLDGVGNRTSQTVGGTSTSFTINSDDQLTATSGGFSNSYGYNSNGEQTSRTLAGTAYTLSYDYDGQLTSIVQGVSPTSFTYDALGRRVSRTAGGTTTNFLYNGGAVLLEKQGSTTTATYTYGNALLRKDGEYPLFDGLGSERTVTNSSQTVTGTLTLDGFGLTVTSTGSSTNPYMFGATSGYRNDGDVGLTQVGARYYDAQVGRFLTRDIVLNEAPYIYCYADPINFIDPDGHLPGWIRGALVGIAVVGLVTVAATILVPAAATAAGGVIGGIVIGGIAGAAGGIAGYGYGADDPGEITWGGIGKAAIAGGVSTAVGGIFMGQGVLPWVSRLLKFLGPAAESGGPTAGLGGEGI
jgi:RHS repeat-associated protein